jgi:hypothetical protein
MNKLVKGLLLALVVSAPVAIVAPAVQAKTTAPTKIALAPAKHTSVKSGKVHHKKHYKHHKHSQIKTHKVHK